MATFFYKCKQNEKITEGHIEAKNMQEASEKLEAQNMFVLELKQKNQTNLTTHLNYEIKPLTIKEKKDFYSSFYRQYRAGISFFEIFNNIIATASSNNIRTLCFNIARKLKKGSPIEDVFEYYSKYIGKAYATLIIAGEKSGKLINILEKITEQVKTEEEIKIAVISKTTYPAIIFALLIVSICIFVFFVFPIFDLATQSETIQVGKICIFAIIKTAICCSIIGLLIYSIIKNDNIQKKFIKWFLNSKPSKKILENYNFFNFFMILHLAQEAGLSQIEAINLSNKIITIDKINENILKTKNLIAQGCEIATAFGVSNIFSDFALSQIATGEKTGELSKAYKEIALDYKQNYMVKIDALLKLLEPSMLIFACICIVIIGAKVLTKYYETLFSAF